MFMLGMDKVVLTMKIRVLETLLDGYKKCVCPAGGHLHIMKWTSKKVKIFYLYKNS